MSLTNFWLSAFRLPNACLKEIEGLCSAFLWPGPELNTKKAKISWKDVCKRKNEGGLGIRPLKEVNTATSLKLIWRIVSSQPSLWVRWIKKYLIRKGSFWSIKESSSPGSWAWRKLLKLRNLAKGFCKMVIHSGRETSFWYDTWFSNVRLKDMLGDRGTIDLGVRDNATVDEVLASHRRRRHRNGLLNDIENEIDKLRSSALREDDDQALWKYKNDKYKPSFSTKATWTLLREEQPPCEWAHSVWFAHNTPKYSFFLWVAMHNRLSTGDRMQLWNSNVDAGCVLCSCHNETRDHLFFSCQYSSSIWHSLVHGLLQQEYTSNWCEIVHLLSGSTMHKTNLFLVRYAFQAAVHSIWYERNSRRNGKEPRPDHCILKFIDKMVRNRLSSIKGEGKRELEDGLQAWFGSRPIQALT